MKKSPPPADPVSAPLQFSDNRLAALLYGEHDRHLTRIEQQLGVTLHSRGNQLMISGGEREVEIAKAALSALYRRLEKGLMVSSGEVDAALRMASEAATRSQFVEDFNNQDAAIKTRRRQVSARTARQSEYIKTLQEKDMVFGLGPAGTGKTYLAVAMAVSFLLDNKVERIILSRPAVEAGERLGFLPGDLREKIDPYLRPLYDALYDMLPADQVLKRLSNGEIEIAPLAFMRGRTLSNAFVILDEAQNTTSVQMKMFLTRLGENSRMAITGDLTQVDLPKGVKSGLRDAIETLEKVEGIGVVRFNEADVVRHALVSRIVAAYAKKHKDLYESTGGGPAA
ncbi:MAG: PhoH family protein [Dongiaceae bacterium]